jgi:hypothetical protein
MSTDTISDRYPTGGQADGAGMHVIDEERFDILAAGSSTPVLIRR